MKYIAPLLTVFIASATHAGQVPNPANVPFAIPSGHILIGAGGQNFVDGGAPVTTSTFASPPAIGNIAPNTGAFTTLGATGALTFNNGTGVQFTESGNGLFGNNNGAINGVIVGNVNGGASGLSVSAPSATNADFQIVTKGTGNLIVYDAGGGHVIGGISGVANSVNFAIPTANSTGLNPYIQTSGSDANIGLSIILKGSSVLSAPNYNASLAINFGSGAGSLVGKNNAWFTAGTPLNPNTATGVCSTTTECWLMRSFINDTVDASAAVGGVKGLNTFYITDILNTGAKGNRSAGYFRWEADTTPSDSTGQAYGGLTAYADAEAPLPGSGISGSGIWGFVAYTLVGATANNLLSTIAVELDQSIKTGGSALFSDGLEIVLTASNAVAATNENAGFLVSAQNGATPTMTTAYGIGGAQGYNPLGSSAYIMQFLPNGGSHVGPSITGGIDLSAFTFSGNAFASPSFSVNGSGKITGSGLILTGLPTSCSGQPTNTVAAVSTVLTLCP